MSEPPEGSTGSDPTGSVTTVTGRPRLVDPALAARVPGLRWSAALAIFLGVITAAVVVTQAVAMAHVVDRSLLHHAALGAVVPAIVVVGVALLVRGGLHAAGDLAAQRTGDRVVRTLRSDLLRHALALGPSWLGGERPGELSVTATRGLRALHTYYARYLPQAAAAAVIPPLLLVWVATQSWLAFLVVVALVVAVPLTMIHFGREATKRAERQWRRLTSLAGRFLLLVEGLPTLRAFGREAQGRREVEAATEGVRSATVRTLRTAFLSALAMDMIAGFGVGLVAMVLGLKLLWGELDLQTAMAVLLVAPEIFIPLRRAGAEFHASTEGQAAAGRVLTVLSTPASGRPDPDGGPVGAPAGAPGPSPTDRTSWGAAETSGTLHLAGVRVEHADRDRASVASCSLDAAPGSRLALTGASGAGKSTVFAALLGFVEPAAGSITFAGRTSDEEGMAAWRRHFAWLPQRPHLFNTTLGANLRLGASMASDDEVARVLDAVGLADLLAGLPGGLDTTVGHDGLTLSWGERQRVALARALLCPAPVLLLDEPTASLDPATVARLGPSIEPWLSGRTVIVAAHQPVLLDRFDATVCLPGAAAPVVVT